MRTAADIHVQGVEPIHDEPAEKVVAEDRHDADAPAQISELPRGDGARSAQVQPRNR